MKSVNGLIAGWIDRSIGDLVRDKPDILTRFAYAMLTSVDSSTDLGELPTTARVIERYTSCRLIGRGILVPADVLRDLAGEFNLFNGFDEIWMFEHEPTLAKPDEVNLVAPLDLRVEDLPTSVDEWVRTSHCGLGLGDGIGTNFVTPISAIGSYLDSLSPAAP